MRVLFVSSPVRGGVMTHLYDLAGQLPVFGIQTYLAFPKGQADEAQVKDLSALYLPEGKCLFYKNPKELITFAVKNQITILHVHSRLVLPDTVTVAQRLQIPLVFTIHGVFPWALYHASELRKATRLIAVGPAQADSAREFRDKVVTILNGVNITRFRPDPNQESKKNPLRILWYGRTRGHASRGAKAVDEAVAILRSRGKHIEAGLIGVAAGVATPNLSRVGWLADPRPLLSRAHITFGHGRSIREAMACGSAGFLLAYGYGGRICKEWFLGENRPVLSAAREYILPEPNPDVISGVLEDLDDDRSLLSNYRKEARAISEQFFDVHEMTRKTKQVYTACFKQDPF
jgi:glycosyltransferase involved in cell wall biosynthesis